MLAMLMVPLNNILYHFCIRPKKVYICVLHISLKKCLSPVPIYLSSAANLIIIAMHCHTQLYLYQVPQISHGNGIYLVRILFQGFNLLRRPIKFDEPQNQYASRNSDLICWSTRYIT